jgi:hypothetical protein
VSFPKAGRTWLRVILDDLQVSLDYRHDGATHSTPRPFEALNLCGKRYATKPVIFLSRDPRDTAISGYFQKNLRRDGYSGSLSDFIRDPLHGVEKIVRYNLTWLQRGTELPAFLPITYEETSADAAAIVILIVAFLGLEISAVDIERAVSDNTFQKMREREASGYYGKRYSDALKPGNVKDANSYKVRRGKVHGYVDYFSVEDLAFCGEILQNYDYFDALRHTLRNNVCRRQALSALAERGTPTIAH